MNTINEDAILDLIEYSKKKLSNGSHTVVIKSEGCFVESPHMYAFLQTGKRGYKLIIAMDGIWNCATESDQTLCYEEINETEIHKAVRHAVIFLNSIKYTNFYGKFAKKDQPVVHFDQIMKRLWNTDVQLNCSVCNEETKTKTLCDHTLCYICWAKINHSKTLKKKCPICRKSIKYSEELTDDESDND